MNDGASSTSIICKFFFQKYVLSTETYKKFQMGSYFQCSGFCHLNRPVKRLVTVSNGESWRDLATYLRCCESNPHSRSIAFNRKFLE